MISKYLLQSLIAFLIAFQVQAESNESPEILKNAETKVEENLKQFARNDNYELLLEARKAASSMNPRGDKKVLSKLDEDSLRLQLKVLLALAKARDPHYDPNASTNIVYVNMAPPLTKDGIGYPSGIDPKAIKDRETRKAYEDMLAENQRRNIKLQREMSISRGVDYAVIDIWYFVRNLGPNSAAKTKALEVINSMIRDQFLRNRLTSDASPGSTW